MILLCVVCVRAKLLMNERTMNEPKKASDVTLFRSIRFDSIRLTLKFRSKSFTSIHSGGGRKRTINHFDSWLAITINSLNASTSIIFKLIFFLLSNLFAFHFGWYSPSFLFIFFFLLVLRYTKLFFFCCLKSQTRCCDSHFLIFFSSFRFFLYSFFACNCYVCV